MATKTKQDYLDEARELGIDLKDLGEDPTVEQLRDAIKAVSDEVPFTADMFLAHHPEHRVPFAGLLAAEPHLAEAELTESHWHRELAEYLKSERP